MKYTLIIMILLIMLSGARSQQEEGIQKQMDELRVRIRNLERENQALLASGRISDSLEYCEIRKEIFKAFANESQLDFDFKSTTEKIAVTGLFTRLMQANNPVSDILGFRFTDVIFSAADKHFKGQLNNEPDRRRFTQIISKIISNPLISTLANSNPITSVVASIITTIIGFTTTSLSMDKEGGRVRDVSIGQRDAFDEKEISEFRSEMQVYINFYDQLILASQRYLAGLRELSDKYAYLKASVDEFLRELHAHVDISCDNDLIGLTVLLPDPVIPGLDFSYLLQDKDIRETAEVARQFPAIQIAVSSFKYEYNLLLLRFLEEYIRILRTAEDFPDQAIDKSRIEGLITEIKSFIISQNLVSLEQPNVFLQ
jgi:hypothetical protein